MNRFLEPSTWAAVATLAQLAGVFFPEFSWLAHAVTAGAGAAGIGLREKTPG